MTVYATPAARSLDHLARKVRTVDFEEAMAASVIIGVVFVGLPLFAFGSFVVQTHAEAFMYAGTPRPQAYGGAIAAQVFAVAALVWLVVALHRALFTVPAVTLAVTASLVALFAVLPGVVGGQGWLTVLLTALVTVLFDLLVAAVVCVGVLRLVRTHPYLDAETAAPESKTPTAVEPLTP